MKNFAVKKPMKAYRMVGTIGLTSEYMAYGGSMSHAPTTAATTNITKSCMEHPPEGPDSL